LGEFIAGQHGALCSLDRFSSYLMTQIGVTSLYN